MYKKYKSSKMAKKNKNKETTTPEMIVNSTPETKTEETKEVASTDEPTTEEVKVEEPKAEKPSKKVIIEDIKETPVAPTKEVIVKEVAAPVVPILGVKDIFEKAISVTPYMLFQNNMLLCRWKPNTLIECFEDGFTLNHVKYTYAGIEVKHI